MGQNKNQDPMKPKKRWGKKESRGNPRVIMIIMYVWIEKNIEKYKKEWLKIQEMMMVYLAWFLRVLKPVKFKI